MKYYASKNTKITDETANKYGKALEKIQIRCNGMLTPDEVVHSAKHASHPLHNHFQWDDSIAAHNFRKTQARRLMRIIVVRSEGSEGVVDMPAFTSVKMSTQQDGEVKTIRVYMPEASIRSDADLHMQTVQDALKRIEFWKERYGHLVELQPIFDAIGEVKAVTVTA
tara:strand:+ start:978 stop:1478 length:501 start_codon:yes stop_codon:yes gene_type:complete